MIVFIATVEFLRYKKKVNDSLCKVNEKNDDKGRFKEKILKFSVYRMCACMKKEIIKKMELLFTIDVKRIIDSGFMQYFGILCGYYGFVSFFFGNLCKN